MTDSLVAARVAGSMARVTNVAAVSRLLREYFEEEGPTSAIRARIAFRLGIKEQLAMVRPATIAGSGFTTPSSRIYPTAAVGQTFTPARGLGSTATGRACPMVTAPSVSRTEAKQALRGGVNRVEQVIGPTGPTMVARGSTLTTIDCPRGAVITP